MIKKHFLVVGGGVGGLFVAKKLSDAGHAFTLIDNAENKSSAVAAGLINPLVFRRMTLSWRTDEFIPKAVEEYRSIEQETGSSFFHALNIRRLFSSEQERQFWIDKHKLPEFSPYMNPLTAEDDTYAKAKNDFGTGRVKQSFYVDTVTFIAKTKQWLATKGEVIHEQLDYSTIDPERVTYKGKSYSGIIFCEGVHVRENPWFQFLPVNSTKGEVLTIRSEVLPENESLNRKCFVLPLGEKSFKVGSTYVWNTYDDHVTEEGSIQLQENLKYVTATSYEIVNQQAGMRPTTFDRRPFLGSHPQFDKLLVMNGLGTKGYMLAPLLSAELCNWIVGKGELHPEVVLDRLIK
jgi:glycine oxidase